MPELDAKDRDDLRASEFAYVDRDGEGHLPINDESHVRNAMARFNQTDFESRAARERARRRILAAARTHGIDIGADSSVWFNAVIRGDVNFIRIGERTNIQDGCLLHVRHRQYPLIVGSNVTFFGEQLNCKVYIEDLFSDLDRHLRENRIEQLPDFISGRFTLPEGTVDGILLWDLLDYLDRPSAQALAAKLVKLLTHDGALLGFFGTTARPGKGFTKFVVVDEGHLRHRPYASTAARQRSPQNRDIIKMFDGLRVSDSFLLQNNMREILFRKGGGGRPII